MKISMAILFLVCLAGCAPQTKGAQSAADADDATLQASNGDGEMECHEETVVGSMIPQRVCVRKADKESNANNAQDFVQSRQRMGMQGNSGN